VSLGDYSSKEVGVIVSLSHASSSKCRKGELAFLVFNFLVLYGAFYSAWILTFSCAEVVVWKGEKEQEVEV
jgi:hypothetical protein